MAVFIPESEVRKLITMDECVQVIDDLFQQEARGLVENGARLRMRTPGGAFQVMRGYALGSKAYGVRTYGFGGKNLTMLYSTETGQLDAVLETGWLSALRTGAASGVATKYMARANASVVGMIGTGGQAVTQAQAMCAVRKVSRLKVFSRKEEPREQFAAQMSRDLGIEVVPVATAEEAVRGSDVVVTITNSRDPVFDGAWLAPGTHVNAAGSNGWARREIDETTIKRAAVIAVDNLEQAKLECGDLIWAADRGAFRWVQAVELQDVVGGEVKGRPSDGAITLFESQGIGIEDVAACAFVLGKARAQGIGQPLPF